MALLNKDIETFRTLYAKRFGIEISKQEAVEMGNQLVNLLRVILKPFPKKVSTEFNQTEVCQQKKK